MEGSKETTAIPRSVAAPTSIDSKPEPPKPITSRIGGGVELFGRYAGVDPTVVSRIENANGFLGVQVRSLLRIAAALKVSPVDLVPGLAVVPKLASRGRSP